ncbi:MAG: prolipoprotein diacylglyceryl transferase, partial [Hyphomicrobiaceae bacterium]|nr:prolipoprotein diacylglyceryl transferase [Hyphomicrobiaceae bacterium]
MGFFAIPFPVIDPVLVEVGPFAIRWYALAYVAGILFAWWLARRLVATPTLWAAGTAPYDAALIDDAITWITLGIVLGGRVGYVLFYNLPFYLDHPEAVLRIWQGGMSFHGGLIGCALGLVFTAWRHGKPLLPLLDIASVVAPVGLFFGRIANFINGELWGRTTDVAWAMVFPGAGPLPRHPSQLYEA